VAEQHDPFPSCDVCGRTILKGEQVHEYLTAQGQRIGVCVLCRSRAESSGWTPASMAHTVAEEQPRRSRGQALRERLGRAASRAKSTARARGEVVAERLRGEEPMTPEEVEASRAEVSFAPEPPAPASEVRVEQEAQVESAPQPERAPEGEVALDASPQAPEAAPEPQPEPAKPRKQSKPRAKRQPSSRSAKRSTQPTTERPKARRKSPAKRGPEALMRRGVERFNSSDERRKVAGLIRSLGEPHAGVRADPRRQLAVVTVAWELSWYQWEVGADGDGDEAEPVRQVAKGDELSELAEDVQAWNASVEEDGTLRLRATAERRTQAAQEA
jgi:hypothetical protein